MASQHSLGDSFTRRMQISSMVNSRREIVQRFSAVARMVERMDVLASQWNSYTEHDASLIQCADAPSIEYPASEASTILEGDGDELLAEHGGSSQLPEQDVSQLEKSYRDRIIGLEDYVDYVSQQQSVFFNSTRQMPTSHTLHHDLITPSALYAVGMNDDGQLGISNQEDGYACTTRFRKVGVADSLQSPDRLQFTQIACGSMWVIGIDTARRAWSWGFDECSGRTGLEYVPTIIHHLRDREIRLVACGEYMTVCVDSEDTLWTWGGFRNEKGDRILLTGIERSQLPLRVPGPAGITQISAGESHCACVDEAGNAYTWGVGEYGQLGRPWTTRRERSGRDLVPTKVVFPRKTVISSSWAVGFHTFWVAEDGLYGSGKNGYGELGLGHMEPVNFPTLIYFPNPIVQIAGGLHHVLFLDSTGKLWVTGRNTYGQCGIDPINCYPTKVSLPQINFIRSGKSSNHSCKNPPKSSCC